MPKKGEKVINEEQLEKLALARQKALEVRRANKEIKDKEKELVKLEKENKKKDLDESITVARKKTVRDLGGNEVPVENIQKQRDHEQGDEENLDLDIKPKAKPKGKKKIKYVYESDSSSEEEVVIVRKKRGGNKKQTQESNEEQDNDKQDTEATPVSNAKPQATPQELQRLQYLQRVSQMPQYRTNLFGDNY